MPLRPLPYREVRRKLEAAGFSAIGSSDSHVKFIRVRGAAEVRTVIVPRHREIAVGTQPSILRQTGLSVDEFEAL